MNLYMSGLDDTCAAIALRERLSFTKSRTEALVSHIRAWTPGVLGCVLLSTCNRTELYLSCANGVQPDPAALLCAAAGEDLAAFRDVFVLRRGEAAVRHLLEVACGLRSRIWGEDQIVSQVGAAITLARARCAADPVLETLFRTAISAGKEMKTRVRLVEIPTSAAGWAVERLRALTGSLAGKRALVIGNGEMGRLSAALLRDAGCAVTVTLRTYRHGETVVPAGCAAVPYEVRCAAMEQADLLVSATTSPHYTVTVGALSALRHMPPLLVDLAIPRDIEPEAGDLPGVTLLNVDTLGSGVAREIPPEAAQVLSGHLERFARWVNYRACMPALVEVKDAITRRVLTTEDIEALDPAALVELAVGRAVDLLAGGLGEVLAAGQLARCNEIIRLHNRGGGEENRHGKRVSLSTVR